MKPSQRALNAQDTMIETRVAILENEVVLPEPAALSGLTGHHIHQKLADFAKNIGLVLGEGEAALHQQPTASRPSELVTENSFNALALRLRLSLTSVQRDVINKAVTHQACKGRFITGRRLRQSITEGIPNDIESLLPNYLLMHGEVPHENYEIKLYGLLASDVAEIAIALAERTLLFLKSRLREEPDVQAYTWAELKSRGIVMDDQQIHFVVLVLDCFGFSVPQHRGGSFHNEGSVANYTWVAPSHIEDLAKLTKLDELIPDQTPSGDALGSRGA